MTFDSDNIDEYLKDPETLRFSFNVASTGEMKALGAAFSIIVRAMQDKSREENKSMRIGLSAGMRRGKSILVAGVLELFADKKSVESSCVEREQNTWKCADAGYVRHYDTRVRYRAGLNSYVCNSSAKFGFPFVDIVENPEHDKNNERFDCLVKLKKQKFKLSDIFSLGADREVTVMITADISNSIAFSDFLKRAEQYRVPEQDNIPLKQRSASNGFPAVKPI